MSERRLGVYAHPDDEFMTSYALTEEGVEAFVFMATDGMASTVNNRIDDPNFVMDGKRRGEAEASLTNLKVPNDPEHRVYAGLPDGELAKHRQKLVRSLSALIVEQEIDTVVTTGADGFDKHNDHITMFEVVVAAINNVRESHGRIVNHITLDSSEGTFAIEPTPEMRRQKLASMVCNYSQHDVRELQPGEQTDDRVIDGQFAVGQEFDKEFAEYWPLLDHESYKVVKPKTPTQSEPILVGRAS